MGLIEINLSTHQCDTGQENYVRFIKWNVLDSFKIIFYKYKFI